MEIQANSITTTGRKKRSRFLTETRNEENSEAENLDGCMHDLFAMEDSMKQNNMESHVDSQSPWYACTAIKGGRGNQNQESRQRISVSDEMYTDDQTIIKAPLECGNCIDSDIEDSQEEIRISRIHEEYMSNGHRFRRSPNISVRGAFGDTSNPYCPTTIDLTENRTLEGNLQGYESPDRVRTKPMLINSRMTEQPWTARRNFRTRSAKSAQQGIASPSSSRRSEDSGVSLWSRLAGSLHFRKANSKALSQELEDDDGKRKNSRKEWNENAAAEEQITTKVMAFVPPIDVVEPEVQHIKTSRRLSKRKLTPPQPAAAIPQLVPKTKCDNACKGTAMWAYSKKIRVDLESKANDTSLTKDMRPTNEDSDHWWAQPRNLLIDKQSSNARQEILTPPTKKFLMTEAIEKIPNRSIRTPIILEQENPKNDDSIEDYLDPVNAANSDLDIDLSDSEDYNKCACFRVLTESMAQLFFPKTFRKRGI